MDTTRFETFMDAVIAIIITVLVLKLAQPEAPTWGAIWALNMRYLTYLTCFIIIFTTWYNDHNLFQIVDEINNSIVMVYGILIFCTSLIPYFASWVALNSQSLASQSMFGILFLLINIFYILATYLIVLANQYNEKLKKIRMKDHRRYVPILIILIGFVVSYTVFVPAIYVSCILATFYWFIQSVLAKSEIESSDRFEALFDAIVAIILTIIVLEIPMAANGSWGSLFNLKLEFVAYVISFIVCFNYWNYNNNLFSIVNRIDGRVIWSIGASMFFLSLIPYFSTFVAENFYSFVAQAVYGIDFIVIALLSIVTSNALKEVDRGNVALLMVLDNHYYLSIVFVVCIGIIIGYFIYPPAIIASCLISVLCVWFWPYLKRL